MRKFLKSVICIMSLLMLLLMYSLPCYATSYDNSFPSSRTGLTGGCFIVAHIGSTEVTILIPVTYRDNCFTFTTSGELFNITNSTISGRIYINNDLYQVRFPAWGTAQYYHQVGGYNQWTDITITNVSDTNVVFDTFVKQWANDSLYVSKIERIYAAELFCLIFFIFLGWFMWHRSLKY